MRKQLTCAIAASISLCTLMQTASLTSFANNPICQTSFSPDPAPVVFGDELYVYTGMDRDGNNDNYYMTGYQCFSTTDMQNWTNHGVILKDTDIKWIKQNSAWASQCIERNGKYYYYITGESSTGSGRVIGVFVADSPSGPFQDVNGKELVGPNWEYIDPTVIIDDDGQAWLMFGNPSCYYVKLKEDMVTLDGPIQKFNLSLPGGTRYGEGPWIYKHDSLYYLVFASFVDAFNGESISYCTGPSVTGPWTFRGTIHEGSNCFTTHGGIIDYKGHSYSFYHMNGLPGGGSFNRSAACEEFTYGSDGSIQALKSTRTGPDQIESFNPFRKLEAETMAWSEGVKVESAGNGSQALGFIENGDYTMLKGVDFGDEGATEFVVSAGSNGEGGMIEVHLDSKTGPIVATAKVPVTGGWQDFTEISGNCLGATGKHDVYFVFSGPDGYLFNVDWWEFKGAGSSSGSSQNGNTTSSVLGDLDNDEKITAKDLSLAHQELKVYQEYTGTSFKSNADVNGNGKIEKDDFQWYVKFLTGQTKEYPEKQTPVTTAPPQTTVQQTTTTVKPASNFRYPEIKFHEAPGYYFNEGSKKGRVINESYNGINGGNKLNVYLPYGYDENKQYNIFYLMHGGNENENTLIGQNDTMIQNMMDHMIENGEVDPMIVVFPTWNKSGADKFYGEFRQSVVPFVEGKYSTYAGKDTSEASLRASRMHRAYGGFSMGSVSTWGVAENCMDIVAYIMPLSGHSYGGMGKIAEAVDRFGLKKGEYFIICATGSTDIAYPNMNPQMDELKQDSHFSYGWDLSKDNFYYMVADGRDHWWGNVRHYVYDILPSFFREGQ
ncbi:MAG: family 43 glycosylhydrolase [Oscillospiraceae bacterium]|nr:family 43 glycosylhydrolase [Oscillospiraceae bacterium]